MINFDHLEDVNYITLETLINLDFSRSSDSMVLHLDNNALEKKFRNGNTITAFHIKSNMWSFTLKNGVINTDEVLSTSSYVELAEFMYRAMAW